MQGKEVDQVYLENRVGGVQIKDKTGETHGIRLDLWGLILRFERYKDTFTKKMKSPK